MEMLEQTYFMMPTFKWLALIVIFLVGYFCRGFIQSLIKKIKSVSRYTTSAQDGFWLQLINLKIEGPLAGVIVALFWNIAIDTLDLPTLLNKYIPILVSIYLAFNLIHLVYLMVDSFGMLLKRWAQQTASGMDDQLVPFATKSLKVLVVVLGVLVFLQNMGLNVVSLLAGLSLGGLALALAAQDTFANLFGSITIFLDNPFKVGDMVKMGDTDGIVEEIGFRSTRIRTLYNSLVSIPNSVVAKEKIDNLGARPFRRVGRTLNLHYDTPIEKIEQFSDALEYHLKNQADIDSATVQVFFTHLGSSSLDLLVVYHVKTGDNFRELEIIEANNFEILKLAQRLGVEFAYPTQTIYQRT